MKKTSTSAFISTMALICYTGFATAQVISFDNPGDLSTLVKELKAPGHGGPGGGQQNNFPAPQHQNGGFGQQDHGNNGPGNHNGPGPQPGQWQPQPGPGHHDGPGPQPGPWQPQPGPGHHDGPGPQPGPWQPQPGPGHHDGPGPQPGPWHPQPGPQPGPWQPQPGPWHPQPGPQPGPWQPHHGGHPNWDNNDWNNNNWNNHGPSDAWWNDYYSWWNNNSHPYSIYRTVCDVAPGASAKGFIIERTMPFNARATFYYYDAYNTIIRTSNPMNSIFVGGNGTPVFDFYQVPLQADHCFLAITQ